MLHRLIVAVVLLAPIALLSDAKPTKPPVPKLATPKQSPAPDLGGDWTIGGAYEIHQANRTLAVFSWTWTAKGVVTDSGDVRLEWLSADGKPALGYYRLVGNDLVGSWGWAKNCSIDSATGTMSGTVFTETIRRVIVSGPEI